MDQEALESASPDPVKPRTGSTRGFVFADLRGYSQYVETNGASAAAALLDRYRRLVRDAVAHSEGTEIQTEGDSFFVVFDSVSAAVRCGLEIAAAAAAGSSSHAPIRVGIGIHAGEAVETGDSYIGSGVNIAARICSAARPGEVLVSETVRALTRNVLDVRFEPRGRPALKGIAERIPVYAVTSASAVAARGPAGRIGRRGLAAAAVTVALVLVAGAAGWVLAPRPAGLPPGEWKIGLITSLTGFSEGDEHFVQVLNGVTLAQEDFNRAGGVHGQQLGLAVLDDQLDEFLPAQHTQTLVNDPSILAMVGPFASGQAIHAAPISNAAGLLHCSPTNTQPELTKPRYGAEDLRGDDPERISFIRIPPADDIQSKALATFAYSDLGMRDLLVVDDGDQGRDLAEAFVDEFEKLGGVPSARTLNEGADARALLEPILNGSEPPDGVFFSGLRWTGGSALRRAMADLGHVETPYLVWDSMLDGPGDDDETYIGEVGVDLARNTYSSHAAPPDPKFSFVEAHRTRFGTDAGEWSAGAYACIEIFFEALRATASPAFTSGQLREAARRYAVDTNRRYETVVGNIGFDENGDNLRQFVGIYRVDPSAAGGAGDWALVKKQDYGPAP